MGDAGGSCDGVRLRTRAWAWAVSVVRVLVSSRFVYLCNIDKLCFGCTLLLRLPLGCYHY